MYLGNFIFPLFLTVLYLVSCESSEQTPTSEPKENERNIPKTSAEKAEITPTPNIVSGKDDLGVRGGRGIEVQTQTVLNPLGEVWQSASRMLGKGVHKFRESLQESVKVARMLRDDVDEGVSKLMNQNPQDPSPNNSHQGTIDEQQLLREGVLGGLLKFMGVNSNQLGVIALNVLIIVAEWITSSLMANNENVVATSRMVKDNLLEWVVKGHNVKVEKLLQNAKSHSLPENIIKTLETKTGNSTACVQLLICKMSPVIWGVQTTVKNRFEPNKDDSNNSTSGRASTDSKSMIDSFLGNLPPKSAFVNFGNLCEKRFPFCKLLKFASH